jgi:hypothetical protein
VNAVIGKLIRRMFAGVVLGVATPGSVMAQLGGTIDLGTGPISWDQAGGRDPLLSGDLGASYRLPLLLGLRPELLGQFGLSTRPAEPAAVRWDIGARLHTTGRDAGAWLGAAFGGAGTGSPSSALTKLEGGIRRKLGPAGINVWVSRTGFGAGIAPRGGLGQDTLPDTLTRARISDYTELGSRASLGLGRYELGLSLIQRLGQATIRRTGWELSATWWLASSIGLVGATGRSLPQFGFSVPGGRYGTVGLRLALGAKSPALRLPGRREAVQSANAPALAVSGRRITVIWKTARRAEVMGDFTDWKPVLLVPAGEGRWTLPLDLAPGTHHLNVRFDAGPWVVPAGVVAVDDGFGGRVGLIVVR